jgi:hypothetical protein
VKQLKACKRKLVSFASLLRKQHLCSDLGATFPPSHEHRIIKESGEGILGSQNRTKRNSDVCELDNAPSTRETTTETNGIPQQHPGAAEERRKSTHLVSSAAQLKQSWPIGWGSDSLLEDVDQCVQVEMQLVERVANKGLEFPRGFEALEPIQKEQPGGEPVGGSTAGAPLVLASFCHVPELQKLLGKVTELKREIQRTMDLIPNILPQKKAQVGT